MSMPTGDCNTCGYHKAMSNPAKGARIPGEFGKCTRPLGLCPPIRERIEPAGGPTSITYPPERPLSVREEKRKQELEAVVIRNFAAFYEVGCALREINNSRLYRVTHRRFDFYCKELFEVAGRTAYHLIEAADVVDNVRQAMLESVPNWAQNESVNNCSQTEDDPENVRNCAQVDEKPTDIPLPQNEAQARALVKVPPERQPEIWQQAVSSAPEGKVTAAHIRRTIKGLNLASTTAAIKKAKDDLEVKPEKMSDQFKAAMRAFFDAVNIERKHDWKHTDRRAVLRIIQTLHTAVNMEL